MGQEAAIDDNELTKDEERMKAVTVSFWRMATIAACVVVVSALSQAQYLEDAQRLATPGLGPGARALGMGTAYSGLATDFTALAYNPAGLAQAKWSEFSLGLSYLGTNDNSTFFNASSTSTNNGTSLNTLGFVLPLDVRRGSASIAFGFTREANFTSGVSFRGFNPKSSIVQTYAPDGQSFQANSGEFDNLAYQLYLANVDSVSPTTNRWNSPIKNNVTQAGTATESGGLNNWMIGGAIDVAPNISFGLTLDYVSGSYRYDRTYTEEDTKLQYANPFDFSQIRFDDFIEDDITGVNMKAGLLFHGEKNMRFGLTVKTPTWYYVSESFGTKGQASFRTPGTDGSTSYGPVSSNGSTKYDVTTPWVFGASASGGFGGVTLSGEIQYTDWTQTQFSNADQATMDENAMFATTFRGTLNYRAGLEYDIHSIGLAFRGGFIYDPSIYKDDPSSFDRKYITGGLGIMLGPDTGLDFGFAHGWWKTYRTNYDATSRVDEAIATNTFLLTLTHRF